MWEPDPDFEGWPTDAPKTAQPMSLSATILGRRWRCSYNYFQPRLTVAYWLGSLDGGDSFIPACILLNSLDGDVPFHIYYISEWYIRNIGSPEITRKILQAKLRKASRSSSTLHSTAIS
jgi:hypothetical protein